MAPGLRAPSHAGSWYSDDPAALAQQLQGWLEAAAPSPRPAPRALISPHAGLSYSGATAAYAYAHLDVGSVTRIFILGPAHHEYLAGIAVTPFAQWGTPFGPLRVDTAAVKALREASTPAAPVLTMGAEADEAEHSLEMQIPFLAYLFRDPAGGLRADVTIVPVVVGTLTPAQEERYGQLLAPHLADPGTVVCVSSDFCHWGRRFRYQPSDPAYPRIHMGIEAMDRRGMALIAAQNQEGWAAYLAETQNTICGRNPITVLLAALKAAPGSFSVQWLHYAQSSPALTMADSSVSYAAAAVFPAPP